MLLQVLKHLILFFADDVLEAEGNFHQPFHMILMIMGNGRVTFQAEAAMPSAQNLVLLSQLRASTQPLAGMLANLLLSQYALSVVPITLWMAVFLTLVRGS
jgi:hypothetical protein